MASVKISVSELNEQRNAYNKAAKNARDVVGTLKKAAGSIGNDRMFEDARSSLLKLAELIDSRAAAIELMSGTLGEINECYQSAEKQSVTVITGFKAHNRDFYGNPVTVKVSSAAGNTTVNTVSVGMANAVSGNTVNVTNTSAVDNVTVNNMTYNNTTVYNGSVQPDASELTSAAGTTAYSDVSEPAVGVQSSYSEPAYESAPVQTAEMPVDSDASVQADRASSFTGAVAAGTVIAGAAGFAAGALSAGRSADADSKQIDRQLDAARQRLKEIENEEKALAATERTVVHPRKEKKRK